jgi:hypothetical protein
MTGKFKSGLILACCFMAMTACASNKKRRCNSCPKWEDRIEWTSQKAQYEEQHQSGSRP